MQGRILIAVIVAGLVVVVAIFLWRASQPGDGAWHAYKQRFVATDGRVVDTGNGGISHSEGQSYGMLLAVAHNDVETFDRIWSWTRQTLRRPDGLFSWRYVPDAEPAIADPNNATDGDLVICWALLQSARTWKRPADKAAALTIADAMRKLIVLDGEDAFLLPAVDGFADDGKRVVNLSYWVFPALKEIAEATGDPIWIQVIATGLRLTKEARFGTHELPPDWLETNADLRPAEGFPPRFGYDVIRLPLYLAWGGFDGGEYLGAISEYWSSASEGQAAPAWIDLVSGTTSIETQSPGMEAVARLIQRDVAPLKIKSESVDDNYYSASLLLLTALAEDSYGQP